MALVGVLAAFQTGTYTVRRLAAGALVLGRWTPGASANFSIDAVVQPLTGNDLKMLPEGFHTANTRRVWTETPLKVTEDGSEPDTIEIGGEDYRVIQSQSWVGLGGDHYAAIVAKVGTP